MRAYGTEPQVWPAGPFSDPLCAHEWGERLTFERSGGTGREGITGIANQQAGAFRAGSAFCLRCGAWRGELGLEPRFPLFICHLTSIFEEVRRVLKPTGCLWLNMGDSYSCAPNGRSAAATKAAGNDDRTFRDKPTTDQHLPAKNRIGQPHRLVFALQDAGWIWRDEICWVKPRCMPSSVTDRTTCQHEFLFCLTKRPHYHYDWFAIREPAAQPAGTPRLTGDQSRAQAGGVHRNGKGASTLGSDQGSQWRNKRSVWTINTEPAGVDHFAAYPRALVVPCIRAGSSEHGCCASCGRPWERIVRKSGGDPQRARGAQGYAAVGNQQDSNGGMPVYTVESLGWRKPCKCPTGERSPSVVLDPFCGTGTTLEVAIELGRHAIGIELKEEYCKMAKRRILNARLPLPGLDTDCPETAPERPQGAPANGAAPMGQGLLLFVATPQEALDLCEEIERAESGVPM